MPPTYLCTHAYTVHTGECTTVGPLYKGHIGTSYLVHCRGVVHSSEVGNVLTL